MICRYHSSTSLFSRYVSHTLSIHSCIGKGFFFPMSIMSYVAHILPQFTFALEMLLDLEF
ncbi:hypothetical protein Syun_019800 [Stephania yunnanensis]|uniref:Uncharacterized protein n=1 Tax=Stephania yunnanensis TaxID=152371 RepID=A0AAP0NX03_9MAGN